MAKKINNLTVIQLLDVKAFLDRQTEQGVKLDTIADLASVAEKVLGFTITTSNIQRVFREFDLDKSNYVKKYEGNSMMIQIATLKKKIEIIAKVLHEVVAIDDEGYRKLIDFSTEKKKD